MQILCKCTTAKIRLLPGLFPERCGKLNEYAKMKCALRGLEIAIFMQMHCNCILQKYICNAIKRKENNKKQVSYLFSL